MAFHKEPQKYDTGQLLHELLAKNLPVDGCASDGRIDWTRKPTDYEKSTAERIKAKHVPKAE